MSYSRPKSNFELSPQDKKDLLSEYFQFYRDAYRLNPSRLNAKIPREAFDDLLDEIGELLINKSEALANKPGQVHDFLEDNPLPEHLDGFLPMEFRAFCLALNALKQWVSAEQAATDRYIFGGRVRQLCREIGGACIITGREGSQTTLELHHPVRDGRPPILLAKEAHAEIEGQVSTIDTQDEVMNVIYPIKRQGNRSWVMLKLGCELLLGAQDTTRGKKVQASSKTFARKASEESGMSYKDLLDWIAKHNLAE